MMVCNIPLECLGWLGQRYLLMRSNADPESLSVVLYAMRDVMHTLHLISAATTVNERTDVAVASLLWVLQ